MPKLLCPVKHMCISNFDSVLNLAHNHYSTFSQKHSASPVSKHFDFLISVIKSQSAECYMFPKSWIPTWYILKPKWVLLSLLQGQPKANCKWGEVCFWVKGFSLARGYNLLHRLETLRLCGKFLKPSTCLQITPAWGSQAFRNFPHSLRVSNLWSRL